MHVEADPLAQDLERFEPDEAQGTLLEAEHMARYRMAQALAPGRRALDLGCGTGYGTAMLVEADAAHVTAVDIAEQAVEATRRRAAGATVTRADIHKLPFDDASFDLVVCLEVIEHVDGQEAALDEIRRVMAPESVVLISSPNRGVYPPGNPHHVHELSSAELRAALAKRFRHVALRQQSAHLATRIGGSDAGPISGSSEVLQVPASGEEPYVVALASDSPLPVIDDAAVLADRFEVGWWHSQVAAAQAAKAAAERSRDEAERRRELAEQQVEREREAAWEHSRRLLELETENAAIPDLRRRITELEGLHDDVDAMEARALRAERIGEEMRASISWRITAPIRGAKRFVKRR